MEILSEKFEKLAGIKKFEKALTAVEKWDQEASNAIEDVEEKSKIVEHRAIFFNKRKIRADLVPRKKLEYLLSSLQGLDKSSFEIQEYIHQFLSSFKPLDNYEKKLVAYLQKEIHELSVKTREAKEQLEAILGLFEQGSKDLEEEFEELDLVMDKIRGFIRQVEHYAKLWEEQVKKEPFINPRKVTLTAEFRANLKKYKTIKQRIQEVMIRIETYPEYQEVLHKVMKGNRPYSGYLRARIDHNLRILYSWNEAKGHLTYEKIITHDQMDRDI